MSKQKPIFRRVKGARREKYQTQKFGNLMSPTIYAELEADDDGSWSAWVWNSDRPRADFRLDFNTKETARRWAVAKLKTYGVG